MQPSHPQHPLIDLTHTLTPTIPVYPGMSQPTLHYQKSYQNNSYYMITDLHLNSHHGTHMDAPCHFVDGKKSVDELSLEQCCGRGRVVDIENRGMGEVYKEIESLGEEIEILLFRTGMSMHWGKPEYQGEFTAISKEVAQLVVKKGFKGVGIDSLSIDAMNSTDFQIHQIILGANIFVLENVNNLDAVKNKEFILMCFPLKILNCDGSPLRVVARLL